MSGRVRVVFYCGSEVLGGAERSLQLLIASLEAPFDPILVATDERVAAVLCDTRPTLPVHVVRPIRGARDVVALARTAQCFRRLRADIVHVNQPSPWAAPYAVLAATVCAPRVVCVVHSPTPPVNGRQRHLWRLLAGRVDRHVAVGAASARRLEDVMGLPAGTVRTIHNGIPLGERRAPVRPAGRVIGTVGRLEAPKRVDAAIEALQSLPEATLVVVGDGPERRSLERLSSALGVASRVTFTGWLDDPRSTIETFDVLVLASQVEALPLVILEAMAAGVPVVASDVGSVGEVVVEGESGLLVPPGDAAALAAAVRSLLESPSDRERIGTAGRRRVEQGFSDGHMAAAYGRLYTELALP